MKFLSSAMFGAVALAGVALTTAPAEARSGVAIQIGPGGFAIGIDQYRDYCRDYRYRHRYYDNCNRYSFNDDYYSDRGDYYRWNQNHRHHRHYYYNSRYDRDHDGRHDRDRHHDRDDRHDRDRDHDNWR